MKRPQKPSAKLAMADEQTISESTRSEFVKNHLAKMASKATLLVVVPASTKSENEISDEARNKSRWLFIPTITERKDGEKISAPPIPPDVRVVLGRSDDLLTRMSAVSTNTDIAMVHVLWELPTNGGPVSRLIEKARYFTKRLRSLLSERIELKLTFYVIETKGGKL